MKRLWSAAAFGIGFLALVSAGCVTGGGYGYYDAAYYQGSGYNYGGWGPQYTVAPVRVEVREGEGEHHDEHGRDRPVPSLPPGRSNGEHEHEHH